MVINLFAILCLLLTSCYPARTEMEPKIDYTPIPDQLCVLPHAFPPLSPDERSTDWGTELWVGNNFAKEMDLYRAITSYKRAQMLISPDFVERRLEIDYDILLAYYLGAKYQDVINNFECSDLRYITPSFPPFHDMLVLLYDSYKHIHDCEKMEKMGALLEEHFPETAQKLHTTRAIETADFAHIPDSLRASYCQCAKSVRRAQLLNAFLPGAGYAYVGQKQSAWTSFAINALFIAAAYQFFHHEYYAAGIITSSLEFGWYAGGINGAGLEARYFNRALYETYARQYLQQEKLFPVLMFQTTF